VGHRAAAQAQRGAVYRRGRGPGRLAGPAPCPARRTEEALQALQQAALVGDLAFPDHQDAPPHACQGAFALAVPLHVLLELWHPVALPGLRDAGGAAAGVLVPEAAIHLDDGPAGREHQVRLPRQVSPVQAEAVAQPVQQAADVHLWLGVLGLVGLHHPAAGGGHVGPGASCALEGLFSVH